MHAPMSFAADLIFLIKELCDLSTNEMHDQLLDRKSNMLVTIRGSKREWEIGVRFWFEDGGEAGPL